MKKGQNSSLVNRHKQMAMGKKIEVMKEGGFKKPKVKKK